ncbi:MAG: hypothetical protein H7221_08505 [Flavobacterium sp.]|nr:hypothetical protein [Flavobacterium sp.]
MPANVTGNTYLINDGFNLFTSVGKRIILNKWQIDLLDGINSDVIVKTSEKGNAAENNGRTFSSLQDVSSTKFDF